MKIKLRKETDRDGYLCMPLCTNVPEGKSGWIKIHCPVCGKMCWKRPEDNGVIFLNRLVGAACTECALKIGMGHKQ